MPKWNKLLPPETVALANSLSAKAKNLNLTENITICPDTKNIFRALCLVPPEKVRCVILGQDPYHTPGQADGLAFSVRKGNGFQPSLLNIFKELEADLGIPKPSHGDLSSWAAQGVLLLNTSLTTQAHSPAAHAGWGWDKVTGEVCAACAQMPQPIAFLLWGKHARDAVSNLGLEGRTDKLVVKSSHPSPFSADKGNFTAPAFFGSRPFSKVNAFLASHGEPPIDWKIPD